MMTADDYIETIRDEAFWPHQIRAAFEAGRASVSADAEPVAWLFQHSETGRCAPLVNDGINNPANFSANNPRFELIGPMFTHPPADTVRGDHIGDANKMVSADTVREDIIEIPQFLRKWPDNPPVVSIHSDGPDPLDTELVDPTLERDDTVREIRAVIDRYIRARDAYAFARRNSGWGAPHPIPPNAPVAVELQEASADLDKHRSQS